MKKFFLIILNLSFVVTLMGQQNRFPTPKIKFNPKTYTCYRAMELLQIDGHDYEESWRNTPWTDTFVDIEGNSKPLPYFDTRVKMLWDDAYFYIYAELQEEHIWANLNQRDAVIYHDNDFEVFIDPDGDTHNYFELEVNALGTIWDLLLIKPYRDIAKAAINAYDMRGVEVGINIKGTLNNPSDKDSGWGVEIAIPWSVINELNNVTVPPKKGDRWKINFSRVQWDTEIRNGHYYKKRDKKTDKVLREHNWVWSPQGIIAMHYPEMWGVVEFSYKVANLEYPKIKLTETEKGKWYLREIYYKLKSYLAEHKEYPKDLSRLKVPEFNSEEYAKMPIYTSTKVSYTLMLPDKKGTKVISLSQDGLVKVNKRGK